MPTPQTTQNAKPTRGPSKKCLRASAKARHSAGHWLRADPYYLGDEAWHYRQPDKANPFKADTEQFADWLRGLRDAEFESGARATGGGR